MSYNYESKNKKNMSLGIFYNSFTKQQMRLETLSYTFIVLLLISNTMQCFQPHLLRLVGSPQLFAELFLEDFQPRLVHVLGPELVLGNRLAPFQLLDKFKIGINTI